MALLIKQVEACPPGGTPLRRKLSSRFVDAMTEFVSSSGDEMAFFKGRQWIPRGVRYPTEEGAEAEAGEEVRDGMEGGGGLENKPSTATATAAESAEEALAAAVDEVCVFLRQTAGGLLCSTQRSLPPPAPPPVVVS